MISQIISMSFWVLRNWSLLRNGNLDKDMDYSKGGKARDTHGSGGMEIYFFG